MVFYPLQRSTIYRLGVVVLALLLALLHTGPLYGSVAALILTVITQLYLPGYLLARALGKLRGAHLVVRLAWVLACGLGLTILLGSAARLVNLPVVGYLLGLHGLMLALALVPDAADPAPDSFGLSRAALPYYALVAFACLVAVGVTYESRYRFFGFEDQAVFISQIDWLAYHPGELIHDLPLRSRQIGVLNGDTRNDTDGWTYNHAAWVWMSGVTASQLIWYDLDPLFVWAVPLIFFALAYHLTGRESAGAWSAAAVVVAGLFTFDNLAYNPSYTSFGRFAVFEVSTLRQASITFMLPLGLLAGLSYLKTPSRSDLFLTALTGLALAIMHPFQATLFAISLGVSGGVVWLAHPSRKLIKSLIPVFAILLIILALPVVQRLNRSGLQAVDSFAGEDIAAPTTQSAITARGFLPLTNVPVLGSTYIMHPQTVFYHPVIVLVVLLGLLHGFGWRRHLASQYVFAVTAAGLIIFFVPGITSFYVKIASWVGILTTIFIFPVALALGLSFDRLYQAVTVRKPRWERPLAVGVFAAALLLVGLLLYEPLPLAASPRDQINAYNEIQAMRRVRPEQDMLIERLKAVLPPDARPVIMSPYEVTNVIIENLPDSLITGGRASRNLAAAGDSRFFTASTPPAPWLDSADLAYLREWGVTHIVLRATDTRLPQMLLQPERFPFLGDAAGYMIFGVVAAYLDATPSDDLFAAMNAAYAEGTEPYRWGRDGFNLVIPGSPERWDSIAALWEAQPASDTAGLGLAFSETLAGRDESALALWRQRAAVYPTVNVYADAAASTAQYLQPGAESIAPLLASLDSTDAAARVLAARSLLTETFFYLLSPEQLDQVIAAAESEPVMWGHLADFDQPDALRKRVSLLMNAGRWETARAWLNQLPAIETSPEDMVSSAALLLVQGDTEGALNYLRPAADADWLTGRRYWHPDRWAAGHNLPAQVYDLLLGEQSRRAGQWEAAERAFRQAADYGAETAGRSFLAQMWLEQGRAEEGNQLLAEVEADWLAAHDTPLPELVSLLTLADTGALYAMQPAVSRASNESRLTIQATYGNIKPQGKSYPIQAWRIQVVNPSTGAVYAESEQQPVFVEGALVRLPVTLTLAVADAEPLTRALVVIQPRYNNAVTATAAITPVILNRPDAAVIPSDATPADLHFGDAITLDSYTIQPTENGVEVTLYWEAAAPPPADYQVFVHVADAEGVPAAQQDSAPANDRYPTSQWPTQTVIADRHTLTFAAPGKTPYTIEIGLYHLPEGVRLPVTPQDARVSNDAVRLGTVSP